jgi:hypothetical protein
LNFARQSTHDLNRWFLDFDAAAPGGLGGGSILLDPTRQLVSIDSVRRNDLLPRRSTGQLMAVSLAQAGMPRPAILEAYNVRGATAAVLRAGSDGSDTPLGRFLGRVAVALVGAVVRWEPVLDGSCYHLWAHVEYP